MTRRLLAILVTGLLTSALFVGADEPPAGPDVPGEGPLRLKRKKRGDDATTPPAPSRGGKGKAGGDKEPGEAKGKDEEPLVPEDGARESEEDEKEVLERLARNMRAVEEKLGNRELGEPTRQQQRDVIRDIDALIKKSENPNQGGGGGGAGGQPPAQGGDDKEPRGGKDKQGAGQPRPGGGSGSRRMARGGSRDRSRGQTQRRPQPGGVTAGSQPGSRPGMPQTRPGGGERPGVGAGGPGGPLQDADRKTINEVWGHLPESLRAEMNAYSNPQPFMPRYDRLIREYYKTIAEQGRKKGD